MLNSTMLERPAGIEVDEKAHEVYIGDGYLNRRIIVFDSGTGIFKRMWGAYGNPPSNTNLTPYNPADPPSQLFRNPVHCVHLSRDGFVYVCDRVNNRIQTFTKEGKFVKEIFVRKETIGMGSAYDLAFSRDEWPEVFARGRWRRQCNLIVHRSDGAIVGTFGHAGRNAGHFTTGMTSLRIPTEICTRVKSKPEDDSKIWRSFTGAQRTKDSGKIAARGLARDTKGMRQNVRLYDALFRGRDEEEGDTHSSVI